VREIVRAHRGEVVMRSEDRAGTTFEVTLPALATPHLVAN
jgi:signal transduction histidine kinase